jgi:hypothetical protein
MKSQDNSQPGNYVQVMCRYGELELHRDKNKWPLRSILNSKLNTIESGFYWPIMTLSLEEVKIKLYKFSRQNLLIREIRILNNIEACTILKVYNIRSIQFFAVNIETYEKNNFISV